MVDLLNGLIEILAKLGEGIVWLLPTSPFTGLQNTFGAELLGYINYYIPIREMLDVASGWLTAIALWYLYSILLRWAKAVQ